MNGTYEVVMGETAEQLLGLRTVAGSTDITNSANAWMRGTVGSIIDFEINATTTTAGGAITNPIVGTVNVLDLDNQLTLAHNFAGVSGSAWSVVSGVQDFFVRPLAPQDNNQITILARNILLSPNVIQNAIYDNVNGKWVLNVDVEVFLGGATQLHEVTMDIVEGTDLLLGGVSQTEVFVVNGSSVTISVLFNDVLFDFDGFVIAGNFAESGNTELLENSIITITPSGDLEITYSISPREYIVDILGITTNNEQIYFDGMVETSVSGTVNHITGEIILSANMVKPVYLESGRLYVFERFEINGAQIEGIFEVTAQSIMNNARIGGNFVVFAVYQRKYIVDFEFTNPSGSEHSSTYDIFVGDAVNDSHFTGIAFNGYAINENETIIVRLTPNIRYEFDVDNVQNQELITAPSDKNTTLVVLIMYQSFDISVALRHRNIRVDFSLSITGNENSEFFGIPQYLGVGTNFSANHTTISDSSGDVVLTFDQQMLDRFNYRATGIEILNFYSNTWVPLVENTLNVQSANFFEHFVDPIIGNASVRLSVIQQYLVSFATPGFTQDGLTFTHSELGSYTIALSGGQYQDIGNGVFLIDYGTVVTITQTEGNTGRFHHFIGLSEQEQEAGIFVVTSSRNIGANFESTALAPWVIPVIGGSSILLLILTLLAIYLIIRSSKLKKAKLAREAEIRDIKRRFNISDEISKLKSGDFKSLPQSDLEQK